MDTNNQSMIMKGIFMYMESFLAVKVWHDHFLKRKSNSSCFLQDSQIFPRLVNFLALCHGNTRLILMTSLNSELFG